MDKRVEQIIEGLQRLLRVSETSFIAMVTDNSKEFTVDVKDMNGTLYPEVRKVGTVGKNGIVPIPSNGSYVIVSRISNSDDLFISMYSEVDSLELMGGSNGGLAVVSSLVEKYNQLENDLNSLKTAIATWTAVPNDGGGALKVALSQWYGQQLAITVTDDIENSKIKH